MRQQVYELNAVQCVRILGNRFQKSRIKTVKQGFSKIITPMIIFYQQGKIIWKKIFKLRLQALSSSNQRLIKVNFRFILLVFREGKVLFIRVWIIFVWFFYCFAPRFLMFKGNGAEFYYYFGHNGQKAGFCNFFCVLR